MNILTASNYYPEHSGGIEFVAKNLVEQWRKHHRVRWIACDISSHPHEHQADDVQLPASNLIEIHLMFPYPLPMPIALKRIFEEARNSEVIHLHDCLYMVNLITFFAAQLYRKPVIVTQHVEEIPYKEAYKRALQKIAYIILGKWVLQNADQVVFISERIKKYFENRFVFRKPSMIIPNGVDKKLFYPPKPDDQNILRPKLKRSDNERQLIFVGRFTQKKGLHLIRKIAISHPHWHWWIIGDGELNPNLWKLDNIEVIQTLPQKQLRQYYLASDLFVLPSIGEGFPLAAQESLACGLPVALSSETASNLPAAPIIDLEVSEPEKIIKVLEETLNDLVALKKMRVDAATFASQWDWEKVAQQYEDVFYSLNIQDS